MMPSGEQSIQTHTMYQCYESQGVQVSERHDLYDSLNTSDTWPVSCNVHAGLLMIPVLYVSMVTPVCIAS